MTETLTPLDSEQAEVRPENLYAFDAENIEVPFNARPDLDEPVWIYHRLRKPTLAELVERESQINYQLVEVSNRESEIHNEQEIANARLWDKIILAIKGYKPNPDWRDITPTEKAEMRPGHKSAAINSLLHNECKLEGDDDTISVGPTIWTVRQEIGPNGTEKFIIRHTLREPTEAERAKFKRSASVTSYMTGAKKSQVRVRTNLKSYVELYDALVEDISGGTVADHLVFREATNRAQFLAAIDPMWKRQIIQCLMSALEAQLSD